MTELWTRRNFCLALGAVGASQTFGTAETGKDITAAKLGVITDEISQDLDKALEFCAGYSLAYCELREIGGKNIMSLSHEDLERARQIVDKHHFKVSEIASPIFKYNLPEMPAQPSEKRDTFMASFTDQDTEDLLKRSFEIARLFGTDKIRIFSYWRVEEPEKAYPHIREHLAKAAAVAAQNKTTLLLENEPSCNVATGKELGRMVRDINSPALRAMWDPGNAVVLNEVPYPDGYDHVRGLFPHMHVKDAKRDPNTGKTAWLPVGGGTVDFRGQFQALARDGYQGTMSLETHYRRPDGNPLESTRESLDGLLKILESSRQ
jgi:sugar phosphate isomerase/epimerase